MLTLVYKAERIKWVDAAKGIAILLVILGHTISEVGTLTEQTARALIFSFHMPLFFILSALTYQFSKSTQEYKTKLKKNFKRLIIPALVLYGLRILVYIVSDFSRIEWLNFAINRLNVLFWGSGSTVHLSGQNVFPFGMMWFFLVLFLSRSIFDFFYLRFSRLWFIISSVLFSFLGVGISYVCWLPLSLDVSFAVIMFLLFGYYLKSFDMSQKSRLRGAVCFIFWIGLLFSIVYFTHDYLELALRRYPIFPVCYITAFAGMMFIAYLCNWLVKFMKIVMPLLYLGKNSFWLYCVHAMDYIYIFLWDVSCNNFINGGIRILLDIFFCILLLETIKIIRFISRRGKAL